MIRIQRIYNFWLFHAIILPLLDVYGLILHIYIIFGTNLLTGGPTRIAVFLPISVFRRKGISNGVQTEWNLRERDIWNERDPEDLECKSRSNRGGHERPTRVEGAPRGWACPLPRGFLVASLTWTPSLPGCFPSRNKFREVSGQLDSIWFSFSAIL